jgi:hypothetical protein
VFAAKDGEYSPVAGKNLGMVATPQVPATSIHGYTAACDSCAASRRFAVAFRVIVSAPTAVKTRFAVVPSSGAVVAPIVIATADASLLHTPTRFTPMKEEKTNMARISES